MDLNELFAGHGDLLHEAVWRSVLSHSPLLAALGLRRDVRNVWLLNPIDHRSAYWNLGEAIDSPVRHGDMAKCFEPFAGLSCRRDSSGCGSGFKVRAHAPKTER